MKVVGIIAEFNPFHNGHKYLIKKAKEITKADYVIVVMSGSFTQNGNIAIYDKFKRAKVAVKNGADLVIELPTIYSISSSEYFATGAISLLKKLGIIDYLVFGSESGDIEKILEIANVEYENKVQILEKTKEEMKKGITFALAHENALKSYFADNDIEEIKKSNNILAIEYLKAIKRLNLNITPFTIKREGNLLNDKSLNKENNFSSATSIREYLYNNKDINCDNTDNKDNTLKEYIPQSMYEVMLNSKAISNEDIYTILKFSILDRNNLKNINGINEGIENKILAEINTSKSYNDFIHNVKSKRYTLAAIKRMLLNIILNITKSDFDRLYLKTNYAHILSMSECGKKLLSQISKISDITVITKLNEKIINKMNDIDKKSLKIDLYASNIHSIILNENINKDYTNRL